MDEKERKRLINRAYARALRVLRDRYDEEFRVVLAGEYSAVGLGIDMRVGRGPK